LAVRVVFTGESPAHAALLGQEQQLRHEVIAQAVAQDADRLWVEKVQLACSAPVVRRTAPQTGASEGADALDELQALAQCALGDADFLQALQTEVQVLLDRLPHELQEAAPELKALRQDPGTQLPGLLAQAVPLLMARVAAAASPSP
jgi:hypothetical protein